MLKAAKLYLKRCAANNTAVKNSSTFFGPDAHWKDEPERVQKGAGNGTATPRSPFPWASANPVWAAALTADEAMYNYYERQARVQFKKQMGVVKLNRVAKEMK